MRVLLSFGRTFQRSGYGLKDGLILRLEHILERTLAGAIPVRHELHARYPRDKRHGAQRLEGCGFHRHVCDVEALGLDGPENRLDDPAPTVELRYPSRRFERVDPMAGQPAGGSISCASTMETVWRAGTPGSIGRFSGCLRVKHAKRTAMRAVRFFGPGRAGNATVCSGCGMPSRREKS